MAKTRLVYFERWADPVALDVLARDDAVEVVRLEYGGDVKNNQARMAEAHGYQIGGRSELSDPWFGDAALIARCPQLLAISTIGAGFDVVDVDACTAAGILVLNQTGLNKEAVAEHALGMMLSLSKKIVQTNHALRHGGKLERFNHLGNDLYGKTVGIVGLGEIGTRMARICARAFDMRVLACDPLLTAKQIEERGARGVDLNELLAQSDYVTLHCPRTPETLGMFGAAQFAAMKRSAYFINTARGGVHDETALYEALTAGQLAGAGLDVFVTEPPPASHPLLSLGNVVVSPHIAGITDEAMRAMAQGAAEQWLGLFRGERPTRLVNPEAWPKFQQRYQHILGR